MFRVSHAVMGALATVLALTSGGCGKGNALVVPSPLPPLSAVALAIHTDTLQTGQTRLFTATALDTLSAVVPNATFDWSSGNPAVISVDTRGAVHAVSEGVAKLYAAAGGHSDSATISVYVNRGWYTQSSKTATDLNGVFFLGDRRTGWAVGNGGRSNSLFGKVVNR